MKNNTPIRWIYKIQKRVETSPCGSELLASRIPIEFILEVRYMLRSLEIPLNMPESGLGDNMSIIYVLHY
jgi:hypothetical protein